MAFLSRNFNLQENKDIRTQGEEKKYFVNADLTLAVSIALGRDRNIYEFLAYATSRLASVLPPKCRILLAAPRENTTDPRDIEDYADIKAGGDWDQSDVDERIFSWKWQITEECLNWIIGTHKREEEIGDLLQDAWNTFYGTTENLTDVVFEVTEDEDEDNQLHKSLGITIYSPTLSEEVVEEQEEQEASIPMELE